MRRHGVLGHVEQAGDLSGRKPIGLVTHQQPKTVQPGALRERRQRVDGIVRIHISSIRDICGFVHGARGMPGSSSDGF